MDVQIGKITHYYDKIGVAVVEVTHQALTVGSVVKISGHDKEFTQTIGSLQMEHKQVDRVEPGQTAGLKVDQAVKPGDVMFSVPSK